jgi:excisionase family DNA binding protein
MSTEGTDFALKTAEEVAEELRVNQQTIRRWHREGRIPAAVAVGNVLRFSMPAVLATLEIAAIRDQRLKPQGAHDRAKAALAEVAEMCAKRRKRGKRNDAVTR